MMWCLFLNNQCVTLSDAGFVQGLQGGKSSGRAVSSGPLLSPTGRSLTGARQVWRAALVADNYTTDLGAAPSRGSRVRSCVQAAGTSGHLHTGTPRHSRAWRKGYCVGVTSAAYQGSSGSPRALELRGRLLCHVTGARRKGRPRHGEHRKKRQLVP